VSEFTAGLMEAKFSDGLKTFISALRADRVAGFLEGIERLMLMLQDYAALPSMVFRPASPNLEPTWITQARPGTIAAAVVKPIRIADELGSEIAGRHTLARLDHCPPRAISTDPPSMLGVKYNRILNGEIAAPLPIVNNCGPRHPFVQAG